MALVKCTCSNCGDEFDREAGAVNRSLKSSGNLFCSTTCSGIARRVQRSDAEKKRIKAEYDRNRREKNRDEINAKKRAAFKLNYDPAKAAEYRKKRMHLHVNYCRTPKYKEWKREYDRRYRAQKAYGDWADCFLLTQAVRAACLDRQSDYEIRLAAGTLSKSQKRKRDYERLNSIKSEKGPLGNAG